jgi:HPt (histidine-containing phosphotransfer) domain-containing protein
MTEQVDQMSRLISDDLAGRDEPQQPACDAECVVNFEQLIGRVVDEDLVEEIMPVCVEDNRKRVEMLARAVDNNDVAGIRNYAHSIKGSAANMGAIRLSEPAGKLERMSADGDISQAPELLSRIKIEFEKLDAFIACPNWMEVAKNQETN